MTPDLLASPRRKHTPSSFHPVLHSSPFRCTHLNDAAFHFFSSPLPLLVPNITVLFRPGIAGTDLSSWPDNPRSFIFDDHHHLFSLSLFYLPPRASLCLRFIVSPRGLMITGKHVRQRCYTCLTLESPNSGQSGQFIIFVGYISWKRFVKRRTF